MEYTRIELKKIKLVKMGQKTVIIVPAQFIKHEILKTDQLYDLEFKLSEADQKIESQPAEVSAQ